MGQLTCFVVVCHILLEAMSLSKIELRQLVGKTSHSVFGKLIIEPKDN